MLCVMSMDFSVEIFSVYGLKMLVLFIISKQMKNHIKCWSQMCGVRMPELLIMHIIGPFLLVVFNYIIVLYSHKAICDDCECSPA